MAMDPGILASRINDILQKKLMENPAFKLEYDGQKTLLPAICEAIAYAIATEVITHITTYAEATGQVSTTVAERIPVATTGSPTAQTGFTTGPGQGVGTATVSPGNIR